MISALPGITVAKPGSAQVPMPGISVDVLDEEGVHVGKEAGGLLVITEPWPSMLRGIWGDPERFRDTYWSKFAHLPNARSTSRATARTSTPTATCSCWAASTT